MTDNEVKWMIVGKLLRRNLMAGVKEATMYLYGGLVLPELPVVDGYPYAYIMKPMAGISETVPYKLLLSTVELRYRSGLLYDFMHGTANGECICYFCTPENATEWTLTDTVYTFVAGESFEVAAARLSWANTDVYHYSNGSIALSAFTPVSVGNGMMGYSGVVLPKLPEWDRETYPYAVIVVYWFTSHKLYVSSKPFTAISFGVTSDGEAQLLSSIVNDTAWGEFGKADSLEATGPVWCNTDILNSDGIIYLAASDPIPVCE